MQITGAGFAMVGEQMPVTLDITAAGPILQLEMVVKAEYLEGGGHSELQILLADAEDNSPSLQVRLQLYVLLTSARKKGNMVGRHGCEQCLAQLVP